MPANVILASAFVGMLGINTHLHFKQFGYENLAAVEGSLRYMGLHNLRDSPQDQGDLRLWQHVADNAHVKFDAYIPEGGPADMHEALELMPLFVKAGLVNYIEGGNEEDDPFPIKQGNTIAIAAAFQKEVHGAARAAKLPVICLSFGSGWTATNNWRGNYDKVGDLAEHCDHANAHVYPITGVGQPGKTIQRLNGVAQLSAVGRPVMMTELGWKTNITDPDAMARNVVNGAFDAALASDIGVYYYALFDDKSGKFGLMNSDGSPRPSGTALHNLTTLLQDNDTGKKNAQPYEVRGIDSGVNSLVFQKSDGGHWIALWDESGGNRDMTLDLPGAVKNVRVFDIIAGTDPIDTQRDTKRVTVHLAERPLLIAAMP